MLFTETMTLIITNLQTSSFITIKKFKITKIRLFLSQSSERFELHILHVDLHFLFNTTDVGLIQSISVAYMFQPSWCWLKQSSAYKHKEVRQDYKAKSCRVPSNQRNTYNQKRTL